VSGPHAHILPNECVGVVLHGDGETPVARLPVRLWSVDKARFVYRTRTDPGGVFYVPRLATGRSYLMVGQIKIDLEVSSESGTPGAVVGQQHDIIVAMPRRALVIGEQVLYDVLVAPLLLRQPERPNIVSP
jgi:hypothetical protein